MNTVWLTTRELDCLAATIGSSSDGAQGEFRLVLDRINDEIGMSAVRSSANRSRKALATISGMDHALMLSDEEHEKLLSLPLDASLREKLSREL